MLVMWERNGAENESLAQFVARVNADVDGFHAIGLRANFGPTADGKIVGQVGKEEIVRHPQTGQAMGANFVNLTVAEVDAAKLSHERAAAVRASRPRMIGS